jgi:PKD repeat protein
MSRPTTYPVNKLILHTTEGSFASAVSWFQSCASGASAHYVVRSSDGFIYQMVDEKDMAWHAGYLSYNQNGIGIEMEGYAADPSYFTTSLTNSVKNIVVWDCNHWGIAKNRVNIIGHNQVPNGSGGWGGASGHTDPGGFFDWDTFIQSVSGTTSTYQQLKITTSTLSVRTGPGASSPLLTTVSLNQEYVAYFQDPGTGWYLIFIPGSNSQHFDGWISNALVSTVPCSNQVEVTGAWPTPLNVRNGPSTTGTSIIDKAIDNQRFVSFNNSGGWYEYYTPASTGSTSGWSSGTYLSVTCGCTSSTAPSGATASTSTICAAGSSTLSVIGGSLGAGAVWKWYSGSCGGTYIGSGSSITVSPSSTTTYFVRAEGTCNTTGCASVTITIGTNSTPPSGITASPGTICAGSSSALSVSGGSLGTGAVWKWYSGSCGGTYIGSGSSITVSPSSTTTYYVRAEGTCNTTTCANTTIAVNPLPVAGTISGASSVCVGASTTLTDGTPGGVWSSSSTSIATVGATGIVTGVSGGSVIISYSVTNSCGTIAATWPFTVTTVPVAGTITGASSVCVGTTITLTDGAAGGVWSSSSTAIATVGGTGIVTGVSGGSVTISYSVTNSCGAAVATQPITVNPMPVAGTIAGASGVCVGATTTLTDGTPGGVWSSSNISVATISGTGVVSGVSAGSVIISYSVTNSCGTAAATLSFSVNVLPVPGTITGATSVCVASTITLTDGAPGGVWSSSSTAIATVSSTGIVTGVSAGSTTISYSVTNACGTAVATLPITVNPLPVAGTIVGATSVCVGSTTTLTDGAPGGVWSSSSTSIATISGAGVVSGIFVGSTTISYSVTNSCGTATTTSPITVDIVPVAGTIIGASTVCEGTNITLTDVAPGGVWSSSSTTIATVGGTGIVTGVSGGSVIISYSVTNACGTAVATQSITVNPLPVAGTITGATSVCVGSTTTLSDGVAGGVWSSSNTSIATVGGMGIVIGIATGSATISYSVTNSCGTTAATLLITVTNTPVADFGASQTSGNCPFPVDFFDLSTPTGTSWAWTIYNGSAGSPITSILQNPTGILYNFSGNYLVKLIVTNTCGYDTKIAANYITVTGDCGTGIDPVANNVEIEINPNPSTGKFEINSSEGITAVIVTNVIGKRIAYGTINKANKTQHLIDLSNQVPGIYFVTIETEKYSVKKKIIKL